jgi:sensor histidine kinase regulating citrate/malate metabolism
VLHVDLQSAYEAAGDTAIWTRIFVHFLSSAGDAIEPGNASENEIHILLRTVDNGTELMIEHTSPPTPEGPKAWTVQDPDHLGHGEGLGFFLNKAFVTNLGGAFMVENNPGAGRARSRMWVPACSPENGRR